MRKRKNIKQQDMKLECQRMVSLLFDYACRTAELDKDCRELVRKHLADCSGCRNTMEEIHSVVGILRTASKVAGNIPRRLTLERRQRILQSLSKPSD
jgi:predicted anti-sigma-YlaC factor YlaD